MRLIFKDLPRELSPHPREGWDKYTYPKVVNWVQETWAGRPLELTRRLTSVQVTRTPFAKTPERAWTVHVHFAKDELNFRGVPLRIAVVGAGYGFRFEGDEEFAKRCEKLPAGKIYTLTGVIDSITVGGSGHAKNGQDVRIHVRDCAIPGIK